MNGTVDPTDVVLPKRKHRKRGIRIFELANEGFDELQAHDVDVHVEMLGDATMYVDLEQINGPRRGLSARLTIWAEPGPWWWPWAVRLCVKPERDA